MTETLTPVQAPRLFRPFGVYRPQADTALLGSALRALDLRATTSVLDVGSGTGALSLLAAAAGARNLTAVDVCRRAVLATWVNTTIRGVRTQVVHGDVLTAVAGRSFDVVLANPPYVPSADDTVPVRGVSRAWDAGRDGRALLDRLCAAAPTLVRPGGTILIVQSGLSDVDATLAGLRSAGLHAAVVTTARVPFGPVLLRRTRLLESRGLIAPGERTEELAVIRGDR